MKNLQVSIALIIIFMAGAVCPAHSDYKSAKVTMKAETKSADDRSLVKEERNRSFTAEKVVEKKSSEQLEWFKKGYEASINKKHDEAIRYYKKALAIDPDYADAHANLGLVYTMKEMFDEAVAELKKTIALDPNHAGAHYNLGLAYDKQGEIKKAIMEYEKTVEITPDFAAAHKNLGIAYLEKGLDAKAADSFYKAGLLFVEQGDEENAFNAYEGLITTKSLELERALFEKLFPGRKKSTLESEILKNIHLDDTPRDIKISTDGLSVYILCSKSLQIYSTQQNKVTGTIPLQGEFSQVAVSPDGKQLFLANGTQKQISIIQITPSYDIAIGASPVIGNADASVTVFAFLDYQWPYCSRVYPVLEQLLEKYPNDVNLVIKHYPLIRIHDFAENASLAALAASRQNKYRELTKALMANYKKLSDETISQHAEEVGLNMEIFNKDYNDPSLKTQVRGDLQLGSSVGVRGVPAVYINGRVVKGSSLQGFSRIVEQELKENR